MTHFALTRRAIAVVPATAPWSSSCRQRPPPSAEVGVPETQRLLPPHPAAPVHLEEDAQRRRGGHLLVVRRRAGV